MQDDDDTRPLTEAERISQTRFGARPIPKGHRRAKTADQDYRRIPPHGDVSPDGQRIWPQPSTAARLLVWGGTAAAAVAVTAGTALVLRRVTDALSGDKPRARDKARPERQMSERQMSGRQMTNRPARPDLSGRDTFQHSAVTGHSRYDQADRPRRPRSYPDRPPEQARADSHRFAAESFQHDRYDNRMRDDHDVGPRASYPQEAHRPRHDDDEFHPRRRPRRRKPRNLIAEFEDNSRRMTHSVDGLFGSLGTAMTGFLSVARQTGTIMREFGDAADLVRTLMDSARKAAPEATRTAPEADSGHADRGADDDRRTHNL